MQPNPNPNDPNYMPPMEEVQPAVPYQPVPPPYQNQPGVPPYQSQPGVPNGIPPNYVTTPAQYTQSAAKQNKKDRKSGFFLYPFEGIVPSTKLGTQGVAIIEWSTLVGMAVYALLFYLVRLLLRITISRPEEPIE
jgi:hypothetical protein